MILFNYYSVLIFIIHLKYILTHLCYECDETFFNYSITVDKLPSPISGDCEIIKADHGCSVRVTWFHDGTSEVHYIADPNLPIDTIVTKTERKVTAWSGEYATKKYLVFNCQASNTTPCNTLENLKRALTSTIWPTDEQIEKFDTLIVPTTDFYPSSCFQLFNASNCPTANPLSCQQCMGIIEYSKQISVCAMCPAGKALANSFEHETTFFLNNKTQSDKIILACRRHGACNSIENIGRLKNGLFVKFDFDKFYRSTASIGQSPIIILLMIFIIGFFRTD